MTDIKAVIPPIQEAIRSGTREKEKIPSAAKFIIFFSGYLVFPANLLFLSYSNSHCLNPAQLTMPLINLYFSGIALSMFITRRSIRRKSPVFKGIAVSDNRLMKR